MVNLVACVKARKLRSPRGFLDTQPYYVLITRGVLSSIQRVFGQLGLKYVENIAKSSCNVYFKLTDSQTYNARDSMAVQEP